MNRFVDQGDMTATQLAGCSYDLLAILHLVRAVTDGAQGRSLSANATEAIGRLMALAIEMHAPLHDALESHEGLKGGAS